MNRTIRFRGKRIDGHGWAYGDLQREMSPASDATVSKWFIVEHRPDLQIVSGAPSNNQYWVEVDPATVGQFTGLQDRKGVDIYEGDVVIVNATWGTYRGLIEYGILEEDGTKHAAFSYKICEEGKPDKAAYYLSLIDIAECGIITCGNIHDTPDLLNV